MSKYYVISEQDLSILAEADYLADAYELADGITNQKSIVSPNPPEASLILWRQTKQSLKS